MFNLLKKLCIAFASMVLLVVSPGGSEQDAAKEALQELQDFVGGWKGNGTSERDKNAIWKESMNWSWRFKGADICLILEVKDSKFLQSGELRYLTDKKLYQLTLAEKNDKSLVFQGTMKKSYLALERVDQDTKEKQELKWNTASAGDRLVATYSVMPQNRTVFNQVWQIGMTREGVTLAAGKKRAECIVTGGLGTIMVSYKGASYYVCCSGCRDAFNEDPQKYIKEYEAKKKKANAV
jgi:hypothetical protein